MLRQGNAGVFILIMMPSAESSTHDPLTSRLMQVIDAVPDSVVATDARGDILFTNPAFVDLVQLNNASLVEQQPLSNWLGRSPVDINLLLANLRKSGRISSLKSQIRGEHGITEEVEVSGTSITGHDSGELGFGFIIRSAARRLTPPIGNLGTSRSVEQLTELVGSVPLKELVRESADLIERLSIETALRLTGNNRAAAAEMLGLSRQSLYVKLRRHQIDDDLADSD
jgi:transcriptional regulator PpsR